MNRNPTNYQHECLEMGLIFLLSAVLTILIFLFGGCASASFEQHQTKPDGTQIDSKTKIVTFWDAKSDIAKVRASTTDKTQGLTVGGIEQETASTNLNSLIEGIVGAAIKAAK